MTALYALLLAASAFLIFWIQPLVAKMLLPLLGGAPAVWNTAVLFFQGALLMGYLYAHGISRFPIRKQVAVHAVVFLAAALSLAGGPSIPLEEPSGYAAWWLLGFLLVYIGLPYGFLASTAPLLQSWFGLSKSKGAGDPYFLYAASNTGSFVALLAFPALLERFVDLGTQVTSWRYAFLVLGAGLASAAALAWKDTADSVDRPDDEDTPTKAGDILRWLGLAFIPSSLMLGVTTHITTDIAAVSLFWIAPLALYLATFVAAFSSVGIRVARVAKMILPLAFVAALLVTLRDGTVALALIPIEVLIVACTSMVLHDRLYQSRPARSSLTTFYLWIAFGGFLGGVLNGLLAPVLFVGIAEYPLVLLLGILAVEWPLIVSVGRTFRARSWRGFRVADAIMVAAVALGIAAWVTRSQLPATLIVATLLFTSLSAGAYAVGATTGGRLVVTLGFLFVTAAPIVLTPGHELHAERSFFGSFSVMESEVEGLEVRIFTHGTTMHGLQAKDPELAMSVQSYYAGVIPAFREFLSGRGEANIGVTGLGAGNLACLGRSEDRVTFFEIDPDVERVARRYFSYLDECPADVDVVIGDARLRLATLADDSFDLLILDAFSSDAVPVHLLTDEAAAEYERVLKPEGVMAFHISNRYLDLARVLARLAEHRDWQAWLVSNEPGEEQLLGQRSDFIVFARGGVGERLFAGFPNARRLSAVPGFRLWTDSYSSLLGVLRW